jgi:hypothetical protein
VKSLALSYGVANFDGTRDAGEKVHSATPASVLHDLNDEGRLSDG